MIFSSASLMKFLLLLLSFATASQAKKDDLNYRDVSTLTVPESELDLLSLESTEQETIVNPSDDSKQDNIAEASRHSIDSISIDETRRKNSPKYNLKLHNVSGDNYDVIHWYSTPIKKPEDDTLDSSIDSQSKIINDKRDLKAQSSYRHYDAEHSVEDDHSHNYHHDEHPHDHHAPYNSEEDTSGEPRTYYQKPQTKKPRRNCSRKGKKAESWVDKPDTIVHSRSNRAHQVPYYGSKDEMSPEGRFYDAPKMPSFPEGRVNSIPELSDFSKERYNLPKTSDFLRHSSMAFSGEHLHGIPRTNFFYKNGENGNHFHLHNHHHHYGPDGKKIGHMQTYRHMIENLGKLKSLVEKDSAAPNSYSSYSDLGSPGDDVTKPKVESRKKGYHYTGPHESYGRKTYYRVNDDSPKSSLPESYSGPQSYNNPEPYNNPQPYNSPVPYNSPQSYNNPESYRSPQPYNSPEPHSDERNIGMEMYRYGAGQYGTDEFHDGPFPNEVSPGIHSSNGFTPDYEKRNPPYSSHEEYNTNSPPDAPYHSYSGDYESKYNQDDKGHKHDQKHETKAPYTPYEAAKGRHGNHQNKDHITEHVHPYQGDLIHEEEKSGGSIPNDNPLEHSAGNGEESPLVTTHSVSYSKDGKLAEDPSLFGPKDQFFNNLRPDPDPLSIPKNALIYEHHIRLHPMHYRMFPPLPVQGHFGRAIGYPVPVHKLIPNPLKMPPTFAPPAPMYLHPRVNQMLHAYQSRSLYHRWW
ncbi:uncharacterized protein LOC118197048 [Stegodyphus dumicola]|uniref:uncharacterized protein LOC118197048 n=1 Tax=Stegodyphus dumicola TaxID=202533 RepID=UPI0015ABC1D3|nr:uncharacterized protein LOC118197048 [Stegodyphus dumicola]